MSEQVKVEQARFPSPNMTLVQQPPASERGNFDCNESKWENGVPGLTIFALRNAMSLVEYICSGKGGIGRSFGNREIERWYSVNQVDATATGSINDGRTWLYVPANQNAAVVQGDLICREPHWDIADNKFPMTFNAGQQACANNPVNPFVTFNVDDDYNTARHEMITRTVLDKISMPNWSNRLVYYFGAVIPQGFFCDLRNKGQWGAAYVDKVRETLANANHGYMTTVQGVIENEDGVLTLIGALANPDIPGLLFQSAMNLLAAGGDKSDFASALFVGQDFNAARGRFQEWEASAERSFAESAQLRSDLNAVLGRLLKIVDSRLTADEKEVLYIMKSEAMNMLAALDICTITAKDCRRNQVFNERNCKCEPRDTPPPPPPCPPPAGGCPPGQVWRGIVGRNRICKCVEVKKPDGPKEPTISILSDG